MSRPGIAVLSVALFVFLSSLTTPEILRAGSVEVFGQVFGPDGVTALPGDGLPITGAEGYVQCIYAGPDGEIDAPNDDGSPASGEVLLEVNEYPGQFYTAIGEGYPFLPNGRFTEDFNHSLTVGAKIYIRVWNGANPANSTHYGDSGLYALQNASFDEHDFGSWSTNTAVPSGGSCSASAEASVVPKQELGNQGMTELGNQEKQEPLNSKHRAKPPC